MDISDKIKEARLKLEKMSDKEFLDIFGKTMVEVIENDNWECPCCFEFTLLPSKGGGLKCSNEKCGYWFCY